MCYINECLYFEMVLYMYCIFVMILLRYIYIIGKFYFFVFFFRLEFVLIEIKWKDVFYWVDLMKIGWI